MYSRHHPLGGGGGFGAYSAAVSRLAKSKPKADVTTEAVRNWRRFIRLTPNLWLANVR